jgi:hypothetical protein
VVGRRGPWICTEASNIANILPRTTNKGWYSRFRIGQEDNCKRKSIYIVGRDSSVGIATRYGLDGPGIEIPVGGRDFPHPSRPTLGSTQPPTKWVQGLSRGESGRDVALTTDSF